MTKEIIRSVDIGHMRNDYADIAILRALRDTLDELNDWTIYDEGEWEEYAREGGAYYAPAIDPYDDEAEFWGRQEATRDYIRELEDRLYTNHDLLGYPDGDSGMYFIERVNES